MFLQDLSIAIQQKKPGFLENNWLGEQFNVGLSKEHFFAGSRGQAGYSEQHDATIETRDQNDNRYNNNQLGEQWR